MAAQVSEAPTRGQLSLEPFACLGALTSLYVLLEGHGYVRNTEHCSDVYFGTDGNIHGIAWTVRWRWGARRSRPAREARESHEMKRPSPDDSTANQWRGSPG